MTRARAAGMALFLLGVFYVIRASRPPTHSTVGLVAGCLLLAAGLLRIVTARRAPQA